MAQPVGGQVYGPQLLHSAAGADSNGTALTVIQNGYSYSFAVFQLTGTLTTVVVYFEGTLDGTNWFGIEAVNVNDSTVTEVSATAVGAWRAVVIGLKKVRARLDWTAGSVTVWATLVA